MTTRRQFVQASIGTTLLSALAAQRAVAQQIDQPKFLYGFPATSSRGASPSGSPAAPSRRTRASSRTRPARAVASRWTR